MKTQAGDIGTVAELQDCEERLGPVWWARKILRGDAEAKTEVKTEVKADVEAEVKTEVKAEAKTEVETGGFFVASWVVPRKHIKPLASSSSSSRVPQQTFDVFLTLQHPLDPARSS